MRVLFKRLLITGIVLAVPTIWIGRAALAYYADVSICFSPLKRVSHQERIDNAVAALTKTDTHDWAEDLKDSSPQDYHRFIDNYVSTKIKNLKKDNCCEVLQDVAFGDSGFNFRWTRSHGVSHIVVPKDRSIQYWPNDDHFHSYRVYQLTNICGEAVSWPHDDSL